MDKSKSITQGNGTGCVPQPKFAWSFLVHFGMNMWGDIVGKPSRGGLIKKRLTDEEFALVCGDEYLKQDRVRFDEKLWRDLSEQLRKDGCNQIVVDVGEFLKYPSHPELAVKGSWDVERFRKELGRLRKMGLEPIPKLNFSTAHDTWLKQYERMLSTEKYYQVCSDLIRDVAEIFDRPRFMHLGYDEETTGHQRKYKYCVVRQGDLWWHDFLWFVKETEKTGMRPWIWSDYVWHHPDLFFKRMPKSVLQSNWYYAAEFDLAKLPEASRNRVLAYERLDMAGFDQVPTGSNWSNDANFAGTVKFCRQVCSPDRLKGFMMAPWFFTLPEYEKKNLEAIDQVGAAMQLMRT